MFALTVAAGLATVSLAVVPLPDACNVVDGTAGGELGTVAVHGAALAEYLSKTDYMDHGATGLWSLERPKPVAVTVGETILRYDNLLLGEKKCFAVGDVSGSFTVDATPPRTVAVPINAEATKFVANVRDLGGWPLIGGGTIRQGHFFRGGRLDDFVAANPGADNFLATALGIRTEIDLRKAKEGVHAAPKGIVHLDVPFNGEADPVPYGLGGTYNQGQIRTVFSTFGAEGSLPVYFHCSVGRDRTGMIAQLLLQLAGVSTGNVYRDYFTSLFADVEGISDCIRAGVMIQEHIAWLRNGGDASAPVTGVTYGNTLAGRTREYLEVIGVTAAELGRITAALTGETPDQIIARVSAAGEEDEEEVPAYVPTGTASSGAFTWTGASSTATHWEDCDNWNRSGKYPNGDATVTVPEGSWQMSAAFDYTLSAAAAKLMQFDSSSRTVYSGGHRVYVYGGEGTAADNFFSTEGKSGFLLESTGTNSVLVLHNKTPTFGYRIRNCTNATFRASAGGALTLDGCYFGSADSGTRGITRLAFESAGKGSSLTLGYSNYSKGVKGDGVTFTAKDGGMLTCRFGMSTSDGYRKGGLVFAAGSSPNGGIVVDNGVFLSAIEIGIGTVDDTGHFVTVQGANPSLTSKGDITLGGGQGGLALTLKPEATWSAAVPRIRADGALTVGSTATFTIDLSNLTLAPGTTATFALLGGATLTQQVQPTFAEVGAYKCGTTTEDGVLYLAVTNAAGLDDVTSKDSGFMLLIR